ncbi:hypothetical protein BpHYR1_005001 [Brachionus plicatilis]|uniref:Uncharacterized protein n=1 Tax=Brachionus plicatilis TaxID=10195 RepID=A0A3M7QJR1_BRAPC|nr:hypothetical protein BpHYR1_005001 [Brachionus plicatilis]
MNKLWKEMSRTIARFLPTCQTRIVNYQSIGEKRSFFEEISRLFFLLDDRFPILELFAIYDAVNKCFFIVIVAFFKNFELSHYIFIFYLCDLYLTEPLNFKK